MAILGLLIALAALLFTVAGMIRPAWIRVSKRRVIFFLGKPYKQGWFN